MNITSTELKNAIELAYNIKPKHRVNVKMTRAKQEEYIGEVLARTQASLIAYECLAAAVTQSSDKEAIAKFAEELFSKRVESLTGIK